MTKEQIASMRRRVASCAGLTLATPAVLPEELTQMLDEREALLAAARHLRDRVERRPDHDWCRGDGDTPEPCGDAGALQETCAAIAKAES